MKSIFILFLVLSCLLSQGQSAKIFYTKTASISFFSEAPLENIEAINKRVTCAFDILSGKIEFKVPINQFEFDQALMQEHFNENYLETEKYPHAILKAQVLEPDNFDFTKPGKYEVKVRGKMTIHGTEQQIENTGIITVDSNQINIEASFDIAIRDYKIKIPKMVIKNIAEIVTITVTGSLKPL